MREPKIVTIPELAWGRQNPGRLLLSKPKDYIKNLNLKFCLQRKIGRSVMEIILPPAMLVVVSWVLNVLIDSIRNRKLK